MSRFEILSPDEGFEALPMPPALFSNEAEQSVLGGLMLDNSAFDRVGDTLLAEHFFDEQHRRIYTSMARMLMACKPVDVITVFEDLTSHGHDDSIGYLKSLASSVPSAANIRRYATIVVERFKARQLMAVGSRTVELAQDGSIDISTRIEQVQGEVGKLAEQGAQREAASLDEAMVRAVDRLSERAEGNINAYATGVGDVDDMLNGGLRPGNVVVMAARPSMGKAQPLDAKVLTANGWREMGSLKVGDMLASVDGEISFVTGVFPQGIKPVVRVTFTDGRSTECCDDHLWSVGHRRWDKPRVMSTREVSSLICKSSERGRYYIDAVSGNFGDTTEIPVDPWLLGALLGDGDFTQNTIRFSKDAEETLERVRSALPSPVELVHAGGCDWRLSEPRAFFGAQDANPLTAAVRGLGLMGCNSATKFVPPIYLTANRDVRLGILRGLMDTDGWAEKHGSVLISTASPQLADDIQHLARSLGLWCSRRVKKTSYTLNGVLHAAQPAHVLTFSGDGVEELFLFEAKRSRCAGRTREKHIAFDRIEPSREAECQCISVSHPSHLYVTDDYIVTHNTALALTVALNMARDRGVGFLSMEMPEEELTDRTFAFLGQVDLSIVQRPSKATDDFWTRITEAMETAAQRRLYIDDQGGLNLHQATAKIRNMVRKHKVQVVIVDYLQLMSGTDAKANRTYQLEEIMRGFKALAKSLGIVIVVLAQVNRKVEGGMPGLADLKDSGAIEQDADVVMFIHRQIQVEPELGPEWQTFAQLRFAKNRQGRTGDTYLSYLGNQTRFAGWSGEIPTKSAKSRSRTPDL